MGRSLMLSQFKLIADQRDNDGKITWQVVLHRNLTQTQAALKYS